MGIDGTFGVKGFDTHVDFSAVNVVKHLDWGGKFLKNRSSLVHEGELKSYTDPSEYHKQITELVTALLLKIFGYSGPYFVLGVGKKNM
jgi:hypothetical protein